MKNRLVIIHLHCPLDGIIALSNITGLFFFITLSLILIRLCSTKVSCRENYDPAVQRFFDSNKSKFKRLIAIHYGKLCSSSIFPPKIDDAAATHNF